jgi:hypothetical protein
MVTATAVAAGNYWVFFVSDATLRIPDAIDHGQLVDAHSVHRTRRSRRRYLVLPASPLPRAISTPSRLLETFSDRFERFRP